VAEFVETKEIFDYLKELGVDYSQGYYFGKPEELKLH
jgi:EAL domain-containing protein (putative c-di-GMP-specific phosphodiesterase class I)